MSLRDEVRTSDPAYTHTFSRVQENKKLSDEIARQMQEWEAKGGQVTVGRIGEVAVDRYITNEFSGKNDAERRLAASKAGGAVHKRLTKSA